MNSKILTTLFLANIIKTILLFLKLVFFKLIYVLFYPARVIKRYIFDIKLAKAKVEAHHRFKGKHVFVVQNGFDFLTMERAELRQAVTKTNKKLKGLPLEASNKRAVVYTAKSSEPTSPIVFPKLFIFKRKRNEKINRGIGIHFS